MKILVKALTVFIFAFSTLIAKSEDIFTRPEPQRLVNDFAGLLSAQENQQLENKLVMVDDSTSTQIAVVIVKDLQGYDANQLATEIGHKWDVGQKGRNNGIVILIKPKIGNERGYAAIQVGYGLEAKITDALSRRIVELEMIPNFKENNYYAGINAAVNAIVLASKGEYKAIPKKPRNNSSKFFFFVILAVIFIAIISSVNNKNKHDSIGRTGSSLPFWLLMTTMMGSSNRSSGGGYGDFSSGSGGFGGFGGGDFGGGGASGSW